MKERYSNQTLGFRRGPAQSISCRLFCRERNLCKPPLRVLLPKGSIANFFYKCQKVGRVQTGGLGLQPHRAKRRSECVDEIMKRRGLVEFKSTDHLGTCFAGGNALSMERLIGEMRFKSMMNNSFACGIEQKETTRKCMIW